MIYTNVYMQKCRYNIHNCGYDIYTNVDIHKCGYDIHNCGYDIHKCRYTQLCIPTQMMR